MLICDNHTRAASLAMEREEDAPDDIFVLAEDDDDDDDGYPQASDPADVTTSAVQASYPLQEEVPDGGDGGYEDEDAERGMESDPYNPDDWDDVLGGEEVDAAGTK